MTPRRPVPPPPGTRSVPDPRRPLHWNEARALTITRRTAFVCAGAGVVYTALFGRLVYVQVVARERFAKQTVVSAERVRVVASPRGVIADRNGAPLVRNAPGFAVVVDPNAWFQDNLPTAEDSPKARRAHALAGLAKLYPDVDLAARLPSEADLDARARLAADVRPARLRTLDVERYVTPERAEAIRSLALPGIGLHPATRRVALNGTHAAHILGSVNAFGEGQSGLEGRYQTELAGVPGRSVCLADFKGVVPGTERVVRPAVPGKDLILTIDSELQHEVERKLAQTVAERHAESGTAVVLDARTGDILALASVPVPNVNDPASATAASRFNNAVQMVYEPGSTFKTITIAAALQAGVTTPDTTYHCSGEIHIGKRPVRCSPHGQFQHGHGVQSLVGVLTHSCNVATARVADRLGADRLHEAITAFGFGRTTGSGLPGEARGLMPASWSRLTVANVGFGQGVAVTPLQLAAAYGAFVDGKLRAPRIVRAWRDPVTGVQTEAPAPDPTPILDPDTAAGVRRMLASVVDHGTGTQAAPDRYLVGGKTGTAQISEGRGYGSRYFASFVGLAPIQDPRFVILVAIKAPKGDHYGGSVAGPVFKFIAERALTLADVAPERDAPPKRAGRGAVAD